jgi:hypothetical protein
MDGSVQNRSLFELENIQIYLREIGLWGVDWIQLAQDRDRWWADVRAVMNLLVLAPCSYLVSQSVS